MDDNDKRQEGTGSMWEEVEKPHEPLPPPKTPEEKWAELKTEFYGKDMLVITEFGLVDFSRKGMDNIIGGRLTYDEFLDAQFAARNEVRTWFQTCFYEAWGSNFKGRIESERKGRICFTRIYVSGCYSDGNGFEGREDHVWMDKAGFESYGVGDCVSFSAEVYRYIKTRNGKVLNYGLRNPEFIERVPGYEVPSDDDLLRQSIDQMICEVCMFNEHCYLGMCIANKEWRDGMRKMLWDAARVNTQH